MLCPRHENLTWITKEGSGLEYAESFEAWVKMSLTKLCKIADHVASDC